MAQNITLMGASYTAVPAVALPKTGGGTAMFSDASVTTAVESDVGVGKIFLLADGSIGTGTSQGGGTPSATSHTIYFEFADGTDTTITAYYDSTFISDAIRATTPSTYSGKVVNTASLDGVEWYNAVAYVVLYEGTPDFYTDAGNYFWIPAMGNVLPTAGSVWRITIDGTEYNCVAHNYGQADIGVIVGNPVHVGGTDDGSGVPVAFYNYNNQAWSGDTTVFSTGGHAVKIERQGTA